MKQGKRAPSSSLHRFAPSVLSRLVFFSLLLAALLEGPLAHANDDLAEQLKADYRDKVLTLRHFYEGNRLNFQSDGSLLGSAEVGPWTVDGQISVQSIDLHGHTLRIRGRRVCSVFDAKAKQFRDVLASLAESGAKDREKREKAFLEKTVDIRIELTTENPDATQVGSAMNAVFLAAGESIRDIVPDFWRDYFNGPDRHVHTTGPIYHVKKGEVSPPHGTFMPDPHFSEEARIAKYQGTMTLSVVVDSSGSAKDIVILSPLGLGLDERAVEQVSSWKFEPAMRDGSPVPVIIAVEVDFHLY